MRVRTLFLLASVALAIGDAPVEGASFTIEEWSLRVAVIGPYPDVVGDSFNDVENPFNESHSVALDPSTASATYDIAWSPDTGFGAFLIEGTHQAEDSGFDSKSSGLIYFDTTVDLTFTIDIAYTYDLPGGALRGGFTILLLDVDTHEYFCGDSQHDDTFDGQPASGTLTG